MVWRACERIGVRPPGVADNFDDCPLDVQAKIIGYNRVREYEEVEVINATRGNSRH